MTDLVAAAERVAEGAFRLELRYRPIDAVNVLVFPETDGLVLVDTGPGADGYLEAIDQGIQRLGLGTVDDVHRIYLTHAHTDHIGQAGAIQHRTGAEVHAHPEAMDFFERRYIPESNDDLLAWFGAHGLPSALLDKLAITLPTRPEAPESTLPYGERVTIQDRPWLVIETGGHAPGHVALYQPDSGQLLAGDAVLEDIVPLIDIQPFRDHDTMHLYLEGLTRLRELDISRVLPAHGAPFAGGKDRIEVLLTKHQQRIQRVLAACAADWQSAYEIFQTSWGRRIEGLTKMRMAFGQVIGYLGYLETEHLVERDSVDGAVRFRIRTS